MTELGVEAHGPAESTAVVHRPSDDAARCIGADLGFDDLERGGQLLGRFVVALLGE